LRTALGAALDGLRTRLAFTAPAWAAFFQRRRPLIFVPSVPGRPTRGVEGSDHAPSLVE